MRKKYLMEALFITLLLSVSSAGAESAYPEATEPEVLFQDDDYIAESGSKQAVAEVIDEDDADESDSADTSDSSYPSTSAKPEVLYQNTDYIENDKGQAAAAVEAKSSSSASASSISNESTADSSTDSASSEETTGEDNSGMINYLMGLLALAGVGFFLKQKSASSGGSKPAKSKRAKKSAVAAKTGPSPSGVTGVGKYLQDKGMGAATGVAKYVEAQAADAATGVEKYLKNKG